MNAPNAVTIRNDLKEVLKGKVRKQVEIAQQSGITPAQLSRFLKRSDFKGLSSVKLFALDQTIQSVKPSGAKPLPVPHANVLAEKLRYGQLALFVGSAVSHLAPRTDRSEIRLPLWKTLAKRVAKQCCFTDADLHDDPLDLFDSIAYGEATNRSNLEAALALALDDSSYYLSVAHERLAQLPWHDVFTSNYDGLLKRLFRSEPVVIENDYLGLTREAGQTRPIHMNGTLQNPHTLTKEDYRQWPQKHPLAYRYLCDVLANRTILIAGYSIKDPHFDALLDILRSITKRRTRLFAWIWQADEASIRLLEKRDNVFVVPIRHYEGWAQAFLQLEAAYKGRCEGDEVQKDFRDLENDPYAYDRARYRQAVDLRHAAANLEGLYLAGPGYAKGDILLEEIYVEPDLLTHPAADVFGGKSKGPFGPEAGYTRDAGAKEDKRLAERIGASAIFKYSPRLIVLGGAGEGKSTLLQAQLLKVVREWQKSPKSHPFPIYIPLGLWESRTDNPGGKLLGYLDIAVPRFAEVGAAALSAWKSGPIYWLLDGLDEIRDQALCLKLCQEISVLSKQRPDDRWLITSRPVGLTAGKTVLNWEKRMLAGLSDAQSLALLTRWEGVFRRKEGSVLNAKEFKRKLTEEIGLLRLKRNALSLTMVVLYYKARRRLPQDRWVFYDHAASALINSWLLTRFGRDNADASYPPNANLLHQLWGRLAYDGMTQGIVTFNRRKLEGSIEELLIEKGFRQPFLNTEISRLVRAAENLVGVLITKGERRFGFLHLSFQEYYAARYLCEHRERVVQAIHRYWDHPAWKEVWKLYVLSIRSDQDRLRQLYRGTLQSKHRIDVVLYRPELQCITWAGMIGWDDGPAWKEISGWVEQVLQSATPFWAQQVCLAGFGEWEAPLPSTILQSVRRKLQHENPMVRQAAVKSLSGNVAEPSIRNAFFNLLSDPHNGVRTAAAASLAGVLGEARVGEALYKGTPSEDPVLPEPSIEKLGEAENETQARETLIEALSDDDARVRRVAARALVDVSMTSEVRNALLDRLRDAAPSVRESAARTLGGASVDATLINALKGQLSDQDWNARQAAAEALGKLIITDRFPEISSV
ncbi:MAG: HEAT repeat domain-containing protein [Nitrospiria bacterium]